MSQKESQSSQPEETHNNNSNSEPNEKKLHEQFNVPDTPFKIIKLIDTYFVTLGKYKISQEFKTFEEAKNSAYDATWEKIMLVIQAMIENNEHTKNPPANDPNQEELFKK